MLAKRKSFSPTARQIYNRMSTSTERVLARMAGCSGSATIQYLLYSSGGRLQKGQVFFRRQVIVSTDAA